MYGYTTDPILYYYMENTKTQMAPTTLYTIQSETSGNDMTYEPWQWMRWIE